MFQDLLRQQYLPGMYHWPLKIEIRYCGHELVVADVVARPIVKLEKLVHGDCHHATPFRSEGLSHPVSNAAAAVAAAGAAAPAAAGIVAVAAAAVAPDIAAGAR